MKKILLTTMAMATLQLAQAQTPNSLFIFGNAGFNSTSIAGAASLNVWNISPGIGYQFDQHWGAGIHFNYQYGHVSGLDTTGTTGISDLSSMQIGLFGRYTHAVANSNVFFWYGQLDAGYQSNMVSGTNVDNGFYIGLMPAIGANVSKCVALTFSIGGINYNSLSAKGGGNYSDFNVTIGSLYNLGVQWNISTAHKFHNHHEMGEDTRHVNTSDDDDDAPKANKHHHKKHKDDDDDDE